MNNKTRVRWRRELWDGGVFVRGYVDGYVRCQSQYDVGGTTYAMIVTDCGAICEAELDELKVIEDET